MELLGARGGLQDGATDGACSRWRCRHQLEGPGDGTSARVRATGQHAASDAVCEGTVKGPWNERRAEALAMNPLESASLEG